MQDLIEISQEKFDVILDLRYATSNNVCQKILYSKPVCYLHKSAIEPLKKAIESANILGLKLKIFDGFRPIEIQKFMFDQFSSNSSKNGFISNPSSGSTPHCRGVAVDLTLCNSNGNELNMGTDFDEFSDLAFHNCNNISIEAQRNRFTLLGIMSAAGWDFYSKEWWHYQLFKPRDYPIVKANNSLIAV